MSYFFFGRGNAHFGCFYCMLKNAWKYFGKARCTTRLPARPRAALHPACPMPSQGCPGGQAIWHKAAGWCCRREPIHSYSCKISLMRSAQESHAHSTGVQMAISPFQMKLHAPLSKTCVNRPSMMAGGTRRNGGRSASCRAGSTSSTRSPSGPSWWGPPKIAALDAFACMKS